MSINSFVCRAPAGSTLTRSSLCVNYIITRIAPYLLGMENLMATRVINFTLTQMSNDFYLVNHRCAMKIA